MTYKFGQMVTVGKYEVTLTEDRTYGYVEHTVVGELGAVWIQNGTLVDYDGMYILPMAVVKALQTMEIEVPADCYED